MIAASGLVHEEFHGPKFAKAEGPFERVQLWVNLPAHDKMSPPRYQGIIDTSIPRIPLPGHSGFRAGYTAEFHVPEGYTTCLFVLKGQVRLPESAIVGEAELAVLEATGTKLALEALEDSTHLLLNGKPLHEPIVGHEPFVMNTQSQIRQAFIDYQSGRMGHLK